MQGISVIKSFHLGKSTGSAVNAAIEQSCNKNLAIEKQMTPYQIFQQIVLNLFAVIIMIVTAVLYQNSSMEFANAVMMFVAAFMVFEQMKSAGISIATLCVLPKVLSTRQTKQIMFLSWTREVRILFLKITTFLLKM